MKVQMVYYVFGVTIYPETSQKTPIGRRWEWYIGCLLCGLNMICDLSLWLQRCVQNRVVLDRVWKATDFVDMKPRQLKRATKINFVLLTLKPCGLTELDTLLHAFEI